MEVSVETAVAVGSDDVLRLAIMPDLWIRIDQRLALAVTTSAHARRRLVVERGLCAVGCDDVVGGAAVDAAFAFAGSSLLGRLALDARRFAPAAIALELGVDALGTSGRWQLAVEPRLAIGVARRDLDNREIAAMPLTIAVEPRPGVALGLTTAVRSQLTASFFDSIQVMTYLTGALSRRGWNAALRVGVDDALAKPKVPVLSFSLGRGIGHAR